MQMKQHRRWGRVRLGVVGVSAALALTVGVGAPAAANDETGFLTSGTLESVVDEDGVFFTPGTPYVTVEISDTFDGAYIATWERRSGTWASAEEAEVYLANAWTQRSQCVIEQARLYVADQGVTDSAAFDARWGTGEGTWNFSSPEWAAINANCQQNEWDWTRTVSEQDPGPTFFVHIPVDVLGAGEHDLFAMPVETSARVVDGTGNAACFVAEYADGQAYWLNDCFYDGAGTAITTTVTVLDVTETETTPPTSKPSASAESPTASQTPEAVAPVSSGSQDWTPLWWSIGIGAAVLAGVVVLLVLFSRRRSSDGSEQLAPAGYPVPVAPPPNGRVAPYGQPGGFVPPFPSAPPTAAPGGPVSATPGTVPTQPPGQWPAPPAAPPAGQSPPFAREPYGLPGPYSPAPPPGAIPPPPPRPPLPEPRTATDPQTPTD